MQSTIWMLGLIIAPGIAFFFLIGLFLMERRWKSFFEEVKTDSSSQPMWILMQQQMEQLRGHMSDGLNRNISLLTEQFRAINEQVSHQLQLVNQQLQSSSGHIGQRLDTARQVISEVREKLGELSKTSEQIHEVGKNIATLQEILRPPKLRGGLGEQFLGELLSQELLPPEFYSLQYPFSSGERVDAVVRLGESLFRSIRSFPSIILGESLSAEQKKRKEGSKRFFAETSGNTLTTLPASIFSPRREPTISPCSISLRRMSTMKQLPKMNRLERRRGF